MTRIGMGQRSLGALLPKTVSFSFHRERRDGVWGWATRLHIGPLYIHAPWIDGLPFPRRRVDAERWVVAFCGRIGIEPMRNITEESARRMAREQMKAERRRANFVVVRGGN